MSKVTPCQISHRLAQPQIACRTHPHDAFPPRQPHIDLWTSTSGTLEHISATTMQQHQIWWVWAMLSLIKASRVLATPAPTMCVTDEADISSWIPLCFVNTTHHCSWCHGWCRTQAHGPHQRCGALVGIRWPNTFGASALGAGASSA